MINRKLFVFFKCSLFLAIILTVGCGPNLTTSVLGNGAIHVQVSDADNQPLSGAKVASNTQPDGQLKVDGLTSTDGDVVFQDIKPGDYEFYVSRFNYSEAYMDITVKPGQTTSITVHLIISNPPLPTPTTTANQLIFRF